MKQIEDLTILGFGVSLGTCIHVPVLRLRNHIGMAKIGQVGNPKRTDKFNLGKTMYFFVIYI